LTFQINANVYSGLIIRDSTWIGDKGKGFKYEIQKDFRGIRLKTMIIIAILVLSCFLPYGLPPAQAAMNSIEEINIRFSTWHLHDSEEVQTVWVPMLQDLKNRSEGRINYTLLDGGALGAGSEHYDIVARGRSDMGYATLTWTPGRFPLSDVLSLPASIQDKDVATEIGKDMYDRLLHLEFLGIKVLEINGCIDSYLWTKKPVHNLEDIQGMRIRSPGGMQTRCIRALGAEPVFMPMSEVYRAIDNGSIDGLVTCPPMVLSYKLYEVAPCGTSVTFGCVDEGLFMNLESWNRTPADLKLIIEEVCGNPYRSERAMTKASYQMMMQDLEEKGVQLYVLHDDEAERWYSRFQDATRLWVADMEARGLPAREAVIAFNEECQERGAKCVAFPPEWR
jgi:TRAP-type C4-dicarboxylate transport system substrate-binding protein